MNLELTNDQKNALDKLEEWLLDKTKSKSHNFFSLIGSAGTGKTTLIKMFIEKARLIIGDNICISAPTHKAKKEIEKKTNWKYSETLQKLLGLKLDVMLEMFDINNPAFSIIGERKMEQYELLIIDESSMINKDLYELVCKTATQYSNNIKVLFVGDLMQLCPVKEYEYSKSLTDPINKYELTEIVRQKEGNPLLELLTVLRKDIENNTEHYKQYLNEHKQQENKKGEGYFCLNSVEFGEKLKEEFGSISYRENTNYLRYLTWTNIVVERSNLWIRKNVFNFDNQINSKEILLSYKNIMEGETPIIFNSDDYLITSVQDVFDKELEINLKRVNLLNTSIENEIGVNIVASDSMSKFSEHFKHELNEAKRFRNKKRWMQYYAFKDQYLLLGNLYDNGQILCKKDLDYGYCLSIHKSQGSTYNTVFVNYKDLVKNLNQFERTRLLYVALSRASVKTYLNFE